MHSPSLVDKVRDQDTDGSLGAPDRTIPANDTVRHGATRVEHPASWKIEVVVDNTDEWEGDPFRLKTRDEAVVYAGDLEFRWSTVRRWRVVQSPDPINQGRLLSRESDVSA